jgi:hypothetical protein
MSRKITAAGSAAIGLALALAATASADVQVRRDLRPGDVVREHGAGVVVPARGHFVATEVLLEDGSQMLSASTNPDGTVLVSSEETRAERAPGRPNRDEMTIMEPPLGRAIPPCDDTAYAFITYRSWSHEKPIAWKSNFRWWFRVSTTPSYMNVDNARAAIGRAAANITGTHNDCDLIDGVEATHDFGGDTDFTPNISTDGTTCVSPDGLSIVAFGTLAPGRLATTCVWGHDDGDYVARITSSDVRMNKAESKWYGIKPADCYDRWSVEAVMTHEFGHSFGLAHVGPEDLHGWLTMSPVGNGACQNSEATLGFGDAQGLVTLY